MVEWVRVEYKKMTFKELMITGVVAEDSAESNKLQGDVAVNPEKY